MKITGIILEGTLDQTKIGVKEMERGKWYGYGNGNTRRTYKLLESDPDHLFKQLSLGKEKDLEVSENSALPNLRKLLINYGHYRLKESLNRDWDLIKMFNIYNSMDEIVNTLYEKSMALGLIVGEAEDPDKFFKNLREFPKNGFSDIGELGFTMLEKKKNLEKIVNEQASIIFPNTSRLISPILCAELLGHYTSLERLVNIPSSSIQMAGAEKSLFLSKTKHIKNPKYGFIFKSSLVSGAPQKERGKTARRLASKIALTLKADGIGRIMTQNEIDKIIKKIKGE
jgi:nucleolar protein 56